jgi:hypothetical protein
MPLQRIISSNTTRRLCYIRQLNQPSVRSYCSVPRNTGPHTPSRTPLRHSAGSSTTHWNLMLEAEVWTSIIRPCRSTTPVVHCRDGKACFWRLAGISILCGLCQKCHSHDRHWHDGLEFDHCREKKSWLHFDERARRSQSERGYISWPMAGWWLGVNAVERAVRVETVCFLAG